MRVMFCGTSAFAVPSLEAAASAHAVVLCVTQPDRPQGRGLKPQPSPVKQAALTLGLPLRQPERLGPETFEGLSAEAGIVVAYGQLIRREVLTWPRHGCLGVHPSLLPKYRGAAPVAHTLLQGDTETGVTIFRLNERLDAGDILLQERMTVQAAEDAEALTQRLAHVGAAALVRGLSMLEAGTATFRPQEEPQASLAPKLSKAQGRIDWRQPATVVHRLIRALVPWPGAYTTWSGGRLKVCAASLGPPAPGAAEPGTVLEADPQGLLVAASGGAVRITDVQPEGKRRMTVAEFLSGHKVKVGDHLGNDE